MPKTIRWPIHPDAAVERPLDYFAIQSQFKFLQGKVLTVIDASLPDTDQRKAVKDLVNTAFSSQLNWIFELCGYPKDQSATESRIGLTPDGTRKVVTNPVPRGQMSDTKRAKN